MAIASNNSNEQVAGGFKMYTGLAPVNVLAINPNKAELEALGYKPKDEPKYTEKDATSGVIKTRIDFIVHNVDANVKAKLTFWMEAQNHVSKTGKTKVINKFGQSTWLDDINVIPANLAWFKNEGVRAAFKGEAELVDFIINWANIKPGDEATLDTIDKIVKGDISELKGILRQIASNEVTVLFSVRFAGDKTYQDIYGKMTQRVTTKRKDLWAKQLTDQPIDPTKGYYTFDFKEYTGEAATVTTPDSDDVFGGNSAPASDIF